MTDCDFVALEKGHPTWPRPAFNLLRVAIGVVGVLLVSAFGWVVSQHFAQAPDKGVDSAQAGVDSAQAGVDSAQTGVDFAQARVNNAQVLVDECIQRQANMNREPAAGKAAEVPWKSDATATKMMNYLLNLLFENYLNRLNLYFSVPPLIHLFLTFRADFAVLGLDRPN
eukprot:g54765.t1